MIYLNGLNSPEKKKKKKRQLKKAGKSDDLEEDNQEVNQLDTGFFFSFEGSLI